jgi:uncharacterized protein (TIGR02453 family)
VDREFQGLTPEAVHFLAALRLNNNKPFFEENRAVYERALRRPLLALARDMAPAIRAIDDGLDTRPERVVSRIYRDARYSRGIPYRDYAWLGWKPADVTASLAFSFYFYVDTQQCGWGLGFYGQSRDRMAAFRERMLARPGRFAAIAGDPAVASFRLAGDDYKKPPEAPGLPGELMRWYGKKTFYLEKTASHAICFGADLAERLSAQFEGLRPLYDFVLGREGWET